MITKKMILVQMASDERVPKNAMGYVTDLHDTNISKAIEKDRLEQLRKYVPELVKEYESEEIL